MEDLESLRILAIRIGGFFIPRSRQRKPFSSSAHANVPGWTAAEVFHIFLYRNKDISSTGLIRFSVGETHCLTGMGTGRLDCMYPKTILDLNVPDSSEISTPILQLCQVERKLSRNVL